MASRVDPTSLVAPTTLEGALAQITLLVEEVKRKEKAIQKLQKSMSATNRAVAQLKKYKEENETRNEREKLKEEIKKECLKKFEEKEQARRRIMRDEIETRDWHYNTTKRYRLQDDY